MLRFIYFAFFCCKLSFTLLWLKKSERSDAQMWYCIDWISISFKKKKKKKTLSALFGPSHTGKHPKGNNNNDIIFLFLSREYVLSPNVKRENVFTSLFATTSLCRSYLKCHAF